MAEDYSTWAYEDLVAEIRREEESLALFRSSLAEARARLFRIERAIREERLPFYEERYQRRSLRIGELEEDIARWSDAIRLRAERVDYLTERIEALERMLPLLTVVDRFIQQRVIASLRRSRSSYLGWQTRQGRYRAHAYAERRGYLRWQVTEEPLVRRLEELMVSQQFWQEEIPSLEKEISAEEEQLKRKRAALPKLHRVKIRLYAVREDPQRPWYYLTFQGFFDIDTILDTETGLPIWDWWLTEEEIEYAKYHFHGYWKGGVDKPKPFDVPDIRQAYLTEDGGIALPEDLEAIPQFKHHKNIPSDYLREAANMTLREIIVGISNIKPRPTDEPEGVFFEYAMIIDEGGAIKWMDNRDRWVWTPTQDIIDRVKEELGIGT